MDDTQDVRALLDAIRRVLDLADTHDRCCGYVTTERLRAALRGDVTT